MQNEKEKQTKEEKELKERILRKTVMVKKSRKE